MLKNYLLIAIRSLSRDKFYTFINIFGLVLGITSCLLIMIYISDELGYDDSFFFSHQFKDITGKSPKKWREQVLEF